VQLVKLITINQLLNPERIQMLYFGYGSNLDWNDWKGFCERNGRSPDGFTEIEPAWILGHNLKFHYHSTGRNGGAADVFPLNHFHATPGALFELDEDTWQTMDMKEGVRGGYYKPKEVLVVRKSGEICTALTYVVCEGKIKPHYTKPSAEYEGLIRRGLLCRELPDNGLSQSINGGWDLPVINHLFVYGTLMTNEVRHGEVSPYIESIEDGSMKGVLYDLDDYPGLKLGEGVVHGELIKMRDVEFCLTDMDSIEGFYGFENNNSLYQRTIVPIQTSEGVKWAWTYVYSGHVEESAQIESGRWKQRM
tara:strand:+ start:5730 stop:6647 length:918 start_codon:yes stop_codon:yes gene_type:complete